MLSWLLSAALSLLTLWFIYRRVLFCRRAMRLEWPEGLPIHGAAKYARFYLSRCGWLLRPDDETPYWGKVLISARKDGCQLDIAIAEAGVLPLQSQIKDADGVAYTTNRTIILVAYGVSADELRAASPTPRVLLITPPQLEESSDLLRAHALTHARA